MIKRNFFVTAFATALFAGGFVLGTVAQTPIAVRYTATTDNVGLRDEVRLELFRWSTDEERDQLLAAWQKPAAAARPEPVAASQPAAVAAAPAAPAIPAGRGAGAAGAGAPRGGAPRGAGGGAAPQRGAGAAAPPQGAGAAAPPQQRGGAAPPRGGAAAAPRGNGAAAPARGAANRGGGGGRGGDAPAEAAAQATPETSLAAALSKAPSVGRMWSSEAAGYSFKYAVRLPQPDGGERIVLVSDRKLNPDIWKPASGTPTNFGFTLLELKLNAKGEGEGKASLTGKITVDAGAKTLALENYATAPVILKGVARR